MRPGRRDLRADLHADRPVLPQQGRRVRRGLPRGPGRLRRPRVRRLRLPPRADDAQAHRGDPRARARPRGDLVQGVHVLRQPRPARPLRRPERVPDDPRGGAVRLRALRVRHARHPGRPRAVPRAGRRDLPVAALRDGRDHDRVHQAGRGGGHASPVWRPTAPRARRTRKGLAVSIASYLAHETGLPTINLLHLSSAQGHGRRAADGRGVPAHQLPPRGDDRPPARRHRHRQRHRRQGQPAAAPARGRRGALGPPARRQDRLGGQRPRLLP